MAHDYRPTRHSDHPRGIHHAVAFYDFAKDGGAIGAITLKAKIPAGAIVFGGFTEVLTTLTSATDAATGALHIEGANDLKSAVAISDAANPWDAGRVALVPVFSAATTKKTTAERNVIFTIAVEALTAGKFAVHILYVMSQQPELSV